MAEPTISDAIKRTKAEIAILQGQLIALEDAAERFGVTVPTRTAPAMRSGKQKKETVRRDDIKPGSHTSRAVDILREAKRTLSVEEILKRMEPGGNVPPKSSLVSALARHVKNGKTFYRPKPGTYGLLELKGGT